MSVVVVPTRLTANGDSGAVKCEGTIYTIEVDAAIPSGTMGGGTVTPYVKSASGNYVVLGSSTLTASGRINVEVQYGDTIKATLSGATNPVLVIDIKKIA